MIGGWRWSCAAREGEGILRVVRGRSGLVARSVGCRCGCKIGRKGTLEWWDVLSVVDVICVGNVDWVLRVGGVVLVRRHVYGMRKRTVVSMSILC